MTPVTTATQWVVMDIGCLECGESSTLLGIFDAKEVAEAAQKYALDQGLGWEGGQHSIEVFEWPHP